MNRKFLNTVPVFVYARDRSVSTKDIITFMIPISENDQKNIKSGMDTDNVIEITSGFRLLPKNIKIFGETDEIPEEIIKDFPIADMWYSSIKDLETRECNVSHNGHIAITQIHDKMYMIKLGIAMLDNPKRAAVIVMRYNDYIMSPFYNRVVKPITHDR